MKKYLSLFLLVACAALPLGACAAVPQPITVRASTEDFDYEAFTMVCDALFEECPLDLPVQIQVLVIDDDVWGRTWIEGGMYRIQIEARQSFHSLLATLEHEWAHAMVFGLDPEEDGWHGPLWGVCRARAYLTILRALQALSEERTCQNGSLALPAELPVETP